MGKEDSAVILYNKLYALDDVYAKHRASKRLGHYYLEHKDMAKAAIFLDEYDRYTDSIQAIIQTETVAKIDAVYNYNIREEENERLKEEITTDRFIITVAAVLVIAAILAVLALIQYSKKKRLAERMKHENEKRYLNSLYEQSSKFISDNNSKIETLKQELAASASKNMSLAAALKAKEEQLNNLNMMAEIRTKNRELAAAGLEKFRHTDQDFHTVERQYGKRFRQKTLHRRLAKSRQRSKQPLPGVQGTPVSTVPDKRHRVPRVPAAESRRKPERHRHADNKDKKRNLGNAQEVVF